MPLGQLADEIVRQSRQVSYTPVLVTPAYLSLRKPFFVALIDTIQTRSKRRVRVDWYWDSGSHLLGLMASVWARRQAESINRCLRRASVQRQAAATKSSPGLTEDALLTGSVEVTASIARPDPNSDVLIVGLCEDGVELPPWTAAVRLSGGPVAAVDDQRRT